MRLPVFARSLPLFLCVFTSVAMAQSKPSEVPGAKDNAMISRYTGSVLQNMSEESFAAVRVPASPGRSGPGGQLVFDKSVPVEGRISGYFYVQPKGRTALEVFRNYQAALQQSGFTTLYSCEMRACDDARIKEAYANEAVRPRKWMSGRADPTGSIDRDVRFLSAKATRQGADAYVMIYVAEPNSLWEAPVAVVLVAEPAPMETGKVVVTTDKLQRGLADEGKIALYGIYFDTGKSELKPESKPQLDEMARLLAGDKSLKIFIVGHTDNQGAVEANVSLSQRRAEAVVAALVSGYKVDANRLKARGVASYSPVATNKTEAGRAKNRRVELVEQ